MVVELVSVLVVDVVEIEGIGDKGFCYKSVNAFDEVLTISVQTHREVAVAIGMGSEEFVCTVVPYSSIIRYTVLGELIDDFPSVYHKMSLLTYISASPLAILISYSKTSVKHYFLKNKKRT